MASNPGERSAVAPLFAPAPGAGGLSPVLASWTAKPDRAVPALLAIFVLFWTAYSAISRHNLDIHGDMVENYAWGIAWQFGYYKHPPLFSWIAAAWFEVFPREQIFYHLLASTNVGVAMAALWRISRRFLDGNQQIVLACTVFFLPCLTFLAANYNATSAMLPFWALSVLFYLRMLERRRIADALLTGAILGLAMLVKYHSAVIVLALAAHMLFDREARPLLKTPLPWLAALAGFAVLTPHVAWLFRMDFATLSYAADQGDLLFASLASAVKFLPVILLYSLPALGFFAIFRRPRDGMPMFAVGQFRVLRETPSGRAFATALVLPVFFTIVLGVATEGELSSLWAIPFFALIPMAIVLLLPQAAARRAPTLGLAGVAVYCVVLLCIAPFVREATLDRARSYSAVPVSLIAREAQEAWRERTGRRLSIVVGDAAPVVNAFAFYASDRPFAVQDMSLWLTPWVTRGMIETQGALAICEEWDDPCIGQASDMLGRVDGTLALTVPAIPGAGGPDVLSYTLLMRHPG
jgi:4-amino-4-deoxy-L-arabinose transferase-like glycosyltransferase